MDILFVLVIVITFFFNIPFGYYRSEVKKFSFMWFFYIHIPVPFIYLIRSQLGVHLTYYTFPFLLISFFLGQRLGNVLFKRFGDSDR